MVLQRGKERDKLKLARKKAEKQGKKQAWRETHGFETDPETLIASAFAAVRDGQRAPRGNPFSATATAFKHSPRNEQRAAEALFSTAARAGLTTETSHRGLVCLVAWRKRWLRRPGDWSNPPESGDGSAIFRGLLHWLLVKYPVPRSFEEAFYRDPDTGGPPKPKHDAQQWFIDLAQGYNLRHCPRLPFPLTKRMAHEVLNAPGQLSLYQALRWGQIIGLGGRTSLAEALCTTPLCRTWSKEGEDFWLDVVQLLARDHLLASRHVPPLIEYLRYQRFGETGPALHPQRVPPPEPRLAVGRRTLSSLVRDSAVWHARFHHYQRREILTWGARGLGLALPQGRFEELTSSADLGHEGEALGHCVATYAAECHAGRAAIVAYRPPLAKPGNRLTLEIDVRHLRLAQVRGQRNRLPTAAEWTVLEAWAKQTKISIPGDLRHPPTPI